MDETVKEMDSMVGGRQRINTAVSRRELATLADRIQQQQRAAEQREREMRSSVGVMVRVEGFLCVFVDVLVIKC